MKVLRIYSKVDRFYIWFVSVFSLFVFGFHLYPLFFGRVDFGLPFFSSMVICFFLVALFIFLPKLTYFEFGEEELTCKTLFFITKKVPYEKIKKLEKSKSLYAGFKFTTALNGLILSFDKYDEVLVGPRNEKLFVDELLKRNASILIDI